MAQVSHHFHHCNHHHHCIRNGLGPKGVCIIITLLMIVTVVVVKDITISLVQVKEAWKIDGHEDYRYLSLKDIFLKYKQYITIKIFHPRVDKGGVKRFEGSDEEKLFPFSYQPIR